MGGGRTWCLFRATRLAGRRGGFEASAVGPRRCSPGRVVDP